MQVVGHTEETFHVLLAGRGWHFLYALDLGRISFQTVSGDDVAHERHFFAAELKLLFVELDTLLTAALH